MSNKKERRRIVKELLDVTDKEFTDEELIHQLINTELSKDSDKTDKLTFGQRAADAVARFAGSWAFIFSFIAIMVIWMVLNIVLKDKAFDAYPFILLNLVLSCIAAVQAPLIMMSQNRQEAKDRERAENDFKVNLKSELIIDDLHRKMDLVLENQKKINRRLDLLEQAENISPDQKKNEYYSKKQKKKKTPPRYFGKDKKYKKKKKKEHRFFVEKNTSAG